MRVAILTNTINGVSVPVYATTEHTASSYGQPVWVDEDFNAYCQCGTPTPFYDINDNITPMQRYGLEIKFARIRAGLTQQQLADRVGCPQSTIARLERARHDARVGFVSEVADALGCDLKIVERERFSPKNSPENQ